MTDSGCRIGSACGPSEARSRRASARGGGAARALRNYMGYTVVRNAGSSSLKFCIYCRPAVSAWRLEARGQIEGIGTSPRFSAKDGNGARLPEALDTPTVRDGRTALDSLAAWLRSQ